MALLNRNSSIPRPPPPPRLARLPDVYQVVNLKPFTQPPGQNECIQNNEQWLSYYHIQISITMKTPLSSQASFRPLTIVKLHII